MKIKPNVSICGLFVVLSTLSYSYECIIVNKTSRDIEAAVDDQTVRIKPREVHTFTTSGITCFKSITIDHKPFNQPNMCKNVTIKVNDKSLRAISNVQ